MEQSKISTSRLLAGAFLTLVLIASGYLLGFTQLTPPKEEEQSTREVSELLAETTEHLIKEIAQLETQVEKQDLMLEAILARLQEQPKQIEEKIVIKEVPQETVRQIVSGGDNIWTIAARFQKPPSPQFVARIIELNNVDPQRLQIGQEILIPLIETE